MVRTRIRVKPRAAKTEVLAVESGATPEDLSGDVGLVVSVATPAEGGKANAAVCKTLATWAGVPRSSVSIVRGQSARIKTVKFATLEKLPIDSGTRSNK